MTEDIQVVNFSAYFMGKDPGSLVYAILSMAWCDQTWGGNDVCI